MAAAADGISSQRELDALFEQAVRSTIAELEATGSPVVTDGEQRKPSFATYPIHGLDTLAGNGVVIPFADGLADLIDEAEADIRGCLEAGAYNVQIDFTEARLSLKLDPFGGLLRSFVDLNNSVLDRFSAEERRRIGVHTCPGGDQDSTHSADVDYAGLLPLLFELHAGAFYLELAGESDPEAVLELVSEILKPDERVFVGVTDPIDPQVETPELVRDRILLAAEHIPLAQLGTTDDCGFSPFADDGSTARETAFAKIRARVQGTELAAEQLGA